MNPIIQVAIIGDFNPLNTSHLATNASLTHAAKALSLSVEPVWIPTPSLEGDDLDHLLSPFHALWCSPGSPYQSMDGALRAICFAREHDIPFTGT